jgi:hypothetical protein
VRMKLTAFFFRIDLSSAMETSLETVREKVLTVHVIEFQIYARDLFHLRYYAAYIGNSLPTFRYSLSVPYSSVKKSKKLKGTCSRHVSRA